MPYSSTEPEKIATTKENKLLAVLQRHTPLGWILRYGAAVAAVAAGMGLRLALTAWIGPGLPTYITFYPAVMTAALLSGFGPGLAATALVGIGVAYWVLPPAGQFVIESPVDRLGLVIFLGMGVFMSLVAELYRRSREKAAAYDREAALREGQEALRKQAELIDPVRAEIIAREMLRVVRERGGAGAAAAVQPDEALRRLPSVAGATVAVVGLVVLAGWAFGSDLLKSVVPGLATMKANTALCFLFAGVALALREHRAVRLACAGMVFAVAGLTMIEYITGGNLGLDQLLFRDVAETHTIYPGRMVEATAVGFLLSGASLLLLKARGQAALWTQQALAAGAGLIGTVAVLGYAYDVQPFVRFAGPASMALPTAASLVILAAGLVIARREGLGAVLVTVGPGAQLTRRLLAAVLLVPAVLGWLCMEGLRRGLFGTGMDIASLALAMIFSLAALVFWAAHALRRAEEARREAEAQLRNQAELMDNAYEPLIVRGSDGVIRSWNRGAEKLYGWPAAEALGQNVHAFLRTEGVNVAEMDAQLERTGHWEGEQVHTRRDGRRVTIEARMTASRIGDGQIFILESNQDVTARKRAEESLRESEKRFRSTMDNMLEGCQILDRDWRYIYINDAAERHNRRPKGELIGKRYMDMWPGVESTSVFAVIRRCMEERSAATLEHEFTFPDGSVGWFDLIVQPVPEGVFILSMDTSERKRAERALLQAHERLALAQESAGAGVWDWDMTAEKLEWSPELFHLFRLDPAQDQATFATWRLLMHPEDRDAAEERVSRAVRDHVRLDNEYRIVLASGEERWINALGDTVYDAGGRPLRMSGICVDITGRKRAELALREATERFRIVADFTYDFEYWIGPDGRFIYISPSCERILGYSRDEVLKDPELFFSAIHPDDRERIVAHVREETAGTQPSELEFRVRRRDGEELWVSHVCQPVLDSAGRSLGRRASNRDISRRKIAEEILRETGEFLENLFTYANAPIICWDTRFKITRFNPAFEHLTNYRLEEVLGKDLSMLFPGDTREESLNKIKRTLSGELWEVVEIPIMRRDGEIRIALWNSANVYAPDGTTITTIIAQGQDITERKHAEQRLKRSNESLEQFAYVASHDLQEPLRTIASYSQLLERRYKDKLDQDADDFIEFIVDAAGRMQKLITDLLAYSRVGSKDLAPGRVDSTEVVRKVIATMSATIEENKAVVTYERLPVLIAPEISFTQIFQNLLGNALKFHGPEPLEIHVAATEHNSEWIFSVRDNGIGIEPQYKERIFQIFQRLHSKQEYPGTGIGLSICKKIVENWGGRIWVESEFGKGSTFYFTIPKERR